jgi:hypothetical protein
MALAAGLATLEPVHWAVYGRAEALSFHGRMSTKSLVPQARLEGAQPCG